MKTAAEAAAKGRMRRPERRRVSWLAGAACGLACIAAGGRQATRPTQARDSERRPTRAPRPAPPAPAMPQAPPIADGRRRPFPRVIPIGRPGHGESNPHAHTRARATAMPGVFEPPEDVEQEDPTLAPGTIAVDLRDPDDHPVAGRDRDARRADQLDREGRQPQARSGDDRRPRRASCSRASRRRATSPTA